MEIWGGTRIVPVESPELMLALSSPAGHSGRSLTTTYETIPYLLRYSPSRRWLLNVVLRHQEGIDDDDQHDQLGSSSDHQEEVDYDRAGHEEVDHHHQEVLDQEEDGHQCLAVCFSISITVSYSVTVRFAAVGRRAQPFGEGAPDRWSPSLKVSALFLDGDEALIT